MSENQETRFDTILNLMTPELKTDFERVFIKGQKASMKRVRAAMSTLQKTAKEVKREMTALRKSYKEAKSV